MKKVNTLLALALPLALSLASCTESISTTAATNGELADSLQTTDACETTINGAYVEYGTFSQNRLANAVMDRHVLGMVSSDQPLLKSVFIEENSMTSLSEEDYKDIVKYILTDRTVLVVEPTVSQWNKFATSLADAYITMVQNDEAPDDAIVTGELFMRNLVHNVRNNIEDDILGLPIAKTQQLGENEAFASLLYLRGNTVRSYDNASENLTRTVSSESYTYDSNGTLVSSVTDNEPQTYMLNASYTDYYIGKMADDIVYHVTNDNEGDDHSDSNSTGATESDLKQLMNAQQFSHVFRADNSYICLNIDGARANWDERSCLVEENYNIWPVYDFDHDIDYYIVHQAITAHNGELKCPSNDQGWSSVRGDYVYFGPYAGNLETKINLIDEEGNVVTNASCINPQPTTHQGSASHTTGVNTSFGGNFGFNAAGLTGGIAGSITFVESYTTSTPDYATELQTSGPQMYWNFKAENTHIKGHFAFESRNCTHDIVPYCYRNDCTFNQSFIYSIPNPTSSRYSLDVYTKQELVAYEGKNTWFYMTDIYHTYQRDTKYKVVLNPPVRFKQDWYMTVQVPQGISQESVRSFLTSHYPKYWKDTFTCYTFTKDDTQPVLGIINDFKNDINNDLASWRNAGFTGTYTISIHPSNSSTVLKTIEFTVE